MPVCNGDLEDVKDGATNDNGTFIDGEEGKKSDKKASENGSQTSDTKNEHCDEAVESKEENKDIKVNGDSAPHSNNDGEKMNSEESAKIMEVDSTKEKQVSKKSEVAPTDCSKKESVENLVTSTEKTVSDVKVPSGNQVNGEVKEKKTDSGGNKVHKSTEENDDGRKKLSKVTQVLKGAKAQTLNLRPIAQMLFDIGMDLTRQNVYRDLIKIQKKKDAMDKLEAKEKEQLALLGESYDNLLGKNESFMLDTMQCTHCGYKTDSVNVMELHRDYAHDQETNSFTCGICGNVTKVAQGFLYHMEAVHHRKGRLVLKHAFFVCPYCPYESNSRGTFQRHMERCTKLFRESHNLVPVAPDCDIPLKLIKPPEKKQLKVAPKPVPPPKPTVREVLKTPVNRPATIVPAPIQEKAQVTKVPVNQVSHQIAQKSASVLTRPPPPRPPVPPPHPPVPQPPVAQSQPSSPAQPTAPLVQMNGQWYRLTTIGAQQFLLPAPAPSVNQMPVNRPQIIVQNQPTVPPVQGQGKSGNFEVCEICGGFVKDRDSLRIHFYWAHKVDIHKDVFKAQEAPLVCPICQKLGKDVRFWTYQGLSRHRSTDHKDVNTSSTGTDRKSEPNGLMKEIPKQCVVCAHVYKNTTTPQQYWSHMEMHGITPTKLFLLRKCLICGVAINEPKRLERHLLTSHASLFDKKVLVSGVKGNTPAGNTKQVMKSPPKSKQLIVCDMCKLSFPTEVVYHRHLDVAHTLKCTRCSQKLNSREVLMRHFHNSHGNEKDACSICNKLVKIGRCMVRHLKSEHVKACSVSLTRLPKAEVAKYLERMNVSAIDKSVKSSGGLKRKSNSVGKEEDVIMIDLDASPVKAAKVEIGKGRGSSKKQILEVDGEEIVVEIQQDAESSESEEDEKTKSTVSVILDDSKSEVNSCVLDDAVENEKGTNRSDKDIEAITVDSESQDKENEEPKNEQQRKEEVAVSDGEDDEVKVISEEKKHSEISSEDDDDDEVICEDVISSDESNDEEVEESENEGRESIDISSDDDEVMEAD